MKTVFKETIDRLDTDEITSCVFLVLITFVLSLIIMGVTLVKVVTALVGEPDTNPIPTVLEQPQEEYAE